MYIRKQTHIYTHTHAYTYTHNRYEARKLEEERKEKELAANEVLLRERMQVFFIFFSNMLIFLFPTIRCITGDYRWDKVKREKKNYIGDGNVA